jgi:hypothetical protein
MKSMQAKQPVARPPAGKAAPPKPQTGIVPVRILHAFYQEFPRPGLQQLAIGKEIRFQNSFLNTARGVQIGTTAPPSEEVFVITDVFMYGIIPGTGLNSPPVNLTLYQLSGLIRFDVRVGNRSPMRLTADTRSPYPAAGQTNPGDLAGWHLLNTQFGSQRTSSFALYARFNQAISVWLMPVVAGRQPRFPISKVGYHIHGLVVPAGEFDAVWERTVE